MGRIRRINALVRRELGQLRAERRAGGAGYAVRSRLAHHAGVDALRAELDAVRARLAEAEARGARLDSQLDSQLDRLGAVLGEHGRALAQHGRAIEAHGSHLGELAELHDGLHHWTHGKLGAAETRFGELERGQSVRVFTDWVEQATLASTPRISVVMPTRNRAALVPRAVASVQAQRYPEWELLIVDDGSDDETPEVVAAFDDPRIRSLRVPHGGCCAARNAALATATGEIVAYLDDDNTMHSLWLRAVAWAFGQRPEVDVLYGAFVVDDVERVNRLGSGAMPMLVLHPYDREVLLRSNLADIGAVAHRAGLPAARFDESLVEMGDWDLLCALTADRDPLVLPAIACFYSTDAPDRLSGGPTFDADYAAVHGKHNQRPAVVS